CVQSPAIEQLDGYGENDLVELGFSLDTERSICAVSSPVDRVSSTRPRTFIHCCCEEESPLSRPFRHDKLINVVEITQDEDFREKSTIDSVLSKMRGLGDVLLCCSPFCGGRRGNV
ncbi:MAG: hypothetical protein ACKPKO_47110, partial [Candidatus Fonsibacter sp.]